MRIERFGIGRICTELQFKNVFKLQGYTEVVIENIINYDNMTDEELRVIGKENNVKNYWNKKRQSLIKDLKGFICKS